MREYSVDIQTIDNYIENIYGIFKSNYKECRKTVNSDSVHDIRVALRKLMTISELLNYMLSNKDYPNKNHSRKFKKLQKLFSSVRDIHVSIEYVEKNIPGSNDFSELLKFLNSMRSANETELKDYLNDKKISDVLRIKNSLREDFILEFTESDFMDILNMCLDDLFLILVEKIDKINPSINTTVHDVRISLKRFKYMYEIFNLFNDENNEVLKTLSQSQDILGEFQDLNVLSKYIEQYGYSKNNISFLTDYINKKKLFLLGEFIENKYVVINLWNLTT